jgi:hypothetical protein
VPIIQGDCATFTLVLTGPVNTGIVQAGTKAGVSCAITTIRGPACD